MIITSLSIVFSLLISLSEYSKEEKQAYLENHLHESEQYFLQALTDVEGNNYLERYF